jgi:hypothetical protein
MSALESTAISQSRPADFIPGYRLDKLVGTGGMGEVHQATQLSLGRTVAVKLLNSDLARDNNFVARFQKEAAALAALSHPHIVSIVDKGHAQGTYYLVMEFVDGASLRERMRSPLDVPTALRMMVEICRAIDYAHGRGVIHRDLKPENILFDQQAGNIAKVTDFGLASFLDEGSGARFALTSTYVAMGTLSYMAPEQRVDAKSADERADVFSLGVILYELLTGEVPLGTFDPPSRRKPGVNPKLDDIVTRCLKPDPAERYPRVSALLADLEPMAPTLYSLPPVPATRMQRVGQHLKRLARRTLQAVAALMVLAAMGVLGVLWWWLHNETKHAPVAPGTAITARTEQPTVQSMAGRVEGNTARSDKRKVVVGEGPDPVQVKAAGRPVLLEGGAILFPEVDTEPRAGQAVLDVTTLEGDTASFTGKVRVDPLSSKAQVRARAHMLVYGPQPEPAAAMLLVGDTHRYVAVVHHGTGAPMSVEWMLGERRGTMTGAAVAPPGEAHLELSVSAEGVLEAFVGTGTDRRQVAEPLDLGPNWQEQFGKTPQPAFGCVESACRASGLTYVIKRLPPPPPPATPAVAEPAPKPQPAPPKVQAVPARATVKPPPAPVRRPTVKAPPPKPVKRTK